MEKLDLSYKNLKKFGITLGMAFAVVTLIIFVRHRHNITPTAFIAALFFILAIGFPAILKPVYILWMRFAFILSWVNTRLILIIIFYLVFTPVGLCLKLFRADLLDIKIDKNKDSYWKKREKSGSGKALYERQF